MCLEVTNVDQVACILQAQQKKTSTITSDDVCRHRIFSLVMSRLRVTIFQPPRKGAIDELIFLVGRSF